MIVDVVIVDVVIVDVTIVDVVIVDVVIVDVTIVDVTIVDVVIVAMRKKLLLFNARQDHKVSRVLRVHKAIEVLRETPEKWARPGK